MGGNTQPGIHSRFVNLRYIWFSFMWLRANNSVMSPGDWQAVCHSLFSSLSLRSGYEILVQIGKGVLYFNCSYPISCILFPSLLIGTLLIMKTCMHISHCLAVADVMVDAHTKLIHFLYELIHSSVSRECTHAYFFIFVLFPYLHRSCMPLRTFASHPPMLLAGAWCQDCKAARGSEVEQISFMLNWWRERSSTEAQGAQVVKGRIHVSAWVDKLMSKSCSWERE